MACTIHTTCFHPFHVMELCKVFLMSEEGMAKYFTWSPKIWHNTFDVRKIFRFIVTFFCLVSFTLFTDIATT